jgi:hypothetical protein
LFPRALIQPIVKNRLGFVNKKECSDHIFYGRQSKLVILASRKLTIVLETDKSLIGIQCKYFVDDFSSTQKHQIRESLSRAVKSYPRLSRYILVMPLTLTMKQQKEVFQIACDFGVPMTIIQSDNIVSMLSKEPDLIANFFD